MGLAGWVQLDGSPLDDAGLRKMVEAAPWLAPDGSETWHDAHAGLAHLRFATTPQAQAERQPLHDAQSRRTLVFDGRLDNREALVRDLAGQPGVSLEAGDARLVMAAFERYGEEMPSRLVGEFALAVWDAGRRRLFCARSALSWVSLCWWHDGGRFVFSTEPAQIAACPGFTRRVNEGVVGEILACRFLSQRETLLDGIYRLPTGCAMAVGAGYRKEWRWHVGPFEAVSRESARGDHDEPYIERFRTLLDQALIACARSPGPVAPLLSGGLDSSTIVCRMMELYRLGRIERPVAPLSAVFPGSSEDESAWIEQVAAHSGARPQCCPPGTYLWDEVADMTRRNMYLPVRPNAMSLMRTTRRLKEHGIRVVLTGEGGDQWLTGDLTHWADLLKAGRVLQILREWQALPAPRRSVHSLFAQTLGPWLKPWKHHILFAPDVYHGPDIPPWIRTHWGRRIDLAGRARSGFVMPGVTGFAQRVRSRWFSYARNYVNLENLRSYAATLGVELRHPFFDQRLGEFLVTVPAHLLFHAGEKKRLLRLATRDTLPPVVRGRGDKASFVHVVMDALMEIMTRSRVRDMVPVQNGWVDGDRLWGLWEDEVRRLKARASPQMVSPIWFAVAVDVWMQQVLS